MAEAGGSIHMLGQDCGMRTSEGEEFKLSMIFPNASKTHACILPILSKKKKKKDHPPALVGVSRGRRLIGLDSCPVTLRQ